MFVERNLSIACAGVTAAIIAPECIAAPQNVGHRPGIGLAIAAILGAVGVFFGVSLVGAADELMARRLRVVVWSLVAVLFAVCIGIPALRSSEWWRSLLFTGLAALPLVAAAAAFHQSKKRDSAFIEGEG